MTEDIKIGIVGLGYVGSATFNGLKDFFSINTFDISKNCSCSSLEELTNSSDIIFVCVPTPMFKNGKCDLSLVDSVITDIDNYSDSKKIIILKSTCLAGTTDALNKKIKNCSIVFNPEFLREKHMNEDFMNQKFIILGGKLNDIKRVKKMYKNIFPDIDYFLTDARIAEMIKYTINNFLALKVSFANEIYHLCDALGINYNKMIDIAMKDSRLGDSHLNVPGDDGKFGYGGACFPKDVSALLHQMEELNVSSYIIKATLARNNEADRPGKDWEQLKGRAVSE
ncbi:MAG: hypothetical protein CMI79_01520 [Candidatus Pelagibacter sp.]|nr:hypothetical protein [Candidatus Pelagibacter sp.]|tara:strand:- start:4205 stop:5050 length:846 start_codon:yes stop_codon:yes gene_type:complete